jgi:perosamine synthetase
MATPKSTPTRLKIPITKPYFGPEESEAIQKPLETGWVVQGPFVKEFEDRFSAFTGAAHSIAASSCTTALHLAVAALGLKPSDEVIVPSFTWVSTANVVEYMGATTVFCDIDLRSFNINVDLLEGLITPRTVGIIPVHLFGLCADMEPILEIARRHHLWVIEDAACGFGAYYHGQHCGFFGEMGCFSFHPRKSITTGEGGMVTTQREDLAAKARSLRDHGASRSDLARHREKSAFLLADYDDLGYNYRLTDFQGALGVAQMDRAGWILKERSRRADLYSKALAAVDWLDLPIQPEGYVHGWQSYVCLFRSQEPNLDNVAELHAQRNAVMARLEEQGIATRQGTHAAALQGYYVHKYGCRPEHFP